MDNIHELMKNKFLIFVLCFLCLHCFAKEVCVLDDFSDGLAKWEINGDCFSVIKKNIDGIDKNFLSTNASKSDNLTGRALSCEFTITKPFLNISIEGGTHFRDAYFRVLHNDKEIGARITGSNNNSPKLKSMDLSEYMGKQVRFEIVDNATCEFFGFINIGEIYLSDSSEGVLYEVFYIKAEKQNLILPIKNDSPENQIAIFDITNEHTPLLYMWDDVRLNFNECDWTGSVPLGKAIGKNLKVQIETPKNQKAKVEQSNFFKPNANYPEEDYRPKYHYTAKSGWTNDINGCFYLDGKWHMYYQYNPLYMGMGRAVYWGHAQSDDLMNWEELPTAIYPFYDDIYRRGSWSGTAWVDTDNKSGLFNKNGKGVIFAYTHDGPPFTENIAYSEDLKYYRNAGQNPIIIGQGRDPKLFWHEPTQRWIIVRYEEIKYEGPWETRPITPFMTFYVSHDLRTWKKASRETAFHECPEYFEIQVDGTDEKKSVLMDGASSYVVGTFDGSDFKTEAGPYKRVKQGRIYAEQTYVNTPDERIIEQGWLNISLDHPTYKKLLEEKMPFTQGVSLPYEIKLKYINGEYRLTYYPAKEVFDAIKKTHDVLNGKEIILGENAQIFDYPATSSMTEIEMDLTNLKGDIVRVNIGKTEILYDRKNNVLSFHESEKDYLFNSEIPYFDKDKLKLKIFTDRLFASVVYDEGQALIFDTIMLGKEPLPISIEASGATIKTLKVHDF